MHGAECEGLGSPASVQPNYTMPSGLVDGFVCPLPFGAASYNTPVLYVHMNRKQFADRRMHAC